MVALYSVLCFILAYRTATTTTFSLPPSSRTSSTSFRWRQLSHSGAGYDEWAIDHIRILGSTYDRQHVINFQLYIRSSMKQESTNFDVRLEFTTDFGQTWTLVQTDCLPLSPGCTQALVSKKFIIFLHQILTLLLLCSWRANIHPNCLQTGDVSLSSSRCLPFQTTRRSDGDSRRQTMRMSGPLMTFTSVRTDLMTWRVERMVYPRSSCFL